MRRTKLAFLCLVLTPVAVRSQTPAHREIAITVDDLPASRSNSKTGAELVELNTKIVAVLKAQNVPAVGFVNERKVYKTGESDLRIKALATWVDNGLELGNHTFNHTSLNNVPLEFWEEEVVRGESITRSLQAQHNMKMRYFRHPYLDTGRDLQTRRAAEAFLASRGYRIAPVTMDAWDWMFAGVYENARARGDSALQQKLVAAYFEHTNDVFDYYEKLSKSLVGYEPKQILLIHGNWLEADHLGELLELLRKRGYQFISLHDALSDSVYSMPDEYVGEEGSGWIDHWAITRGQPTLNSPECPQWVLDLSKALPASPPEPPLF